MKRNRFFSAAALSLIALYANSATAEGDKHDLKPKFAKDSVIKYVMTQDTSGSMKQGEQERKASQSQTLHLTRKVVSTTETSATVELTITRVVASSTPPMGGDPVSFDSEQPVDKDAGNMLALKYRQMIGKPYTLEIALDGTITSVKLPADSLVTDSTEAMKSTFGPLFQIKQGEPLTSVGESWEKSEAIGAAAQGLESKAKLTLSEVKDSIANIAFKSVIAFKEGTAPPGMVFKEAGVDGTVLWNISDGALTEMKGVQKMNMSNADMALEVDSTTNMLIKREE